jgi:hypothetical protein
MGSLRFALIGGGLGGALLVGACGLESGGPGEDPDSGMTPDVIMADGFGGDGFMLPDAPMDIMTPDLGTGETEAGTLCTCTPAVPNGWSPVIYSQKSRPGCGKDFDSPANTVENVTFNPTVCACGCNINPTTQPSCTGNVTFTMGYANNCGTTSNTTITANSTCTMGTWQFSATSNDLNNMSATANAPSPSSGACGNVAVGKSLGAVMMDSGRTCKPKVAPGSCGAGLCVPTPMAPDSVCIEMAGHQTTCPGGFPNQHWVGTTNNPTLDNRDCAANQPCGFTNMGTCSKPTLSLWQSNNTCTGNEAFGPYLADGTCHNPGFGNGVTFQSARYASTPSGAQCGYTGQCTASGKVFINPATEMTVCCL